MGADLLAHAVACGAVETCRLLIGVLLAHAPPAARVGGAAHGGGASPVAVAAGADEAAEAGGAAPAGRVALLRTLLQLVRNGSDSGAAGQAA